MPFSPGSASPLGATCDPNGVDFALFSEHADAVELCLFDAAEPVRETARVALVRGEDTVWRGRVAALGPGALYGYRVHGAYAPDEGHRFNSAKLLIDPYARAITPLPGWSDRLLGYAPGGPEGDLARDERDDVAEAPRAIVVDPSFDWGDDRPPRTPWERTLIYEAHVKGMTARHPAVPEGLRGTYLGLTTPPVLEHLVGLGVTAVELLPVHHVVSERHLASHGLTNYWGYNTLGFFAPDARFATGEGRGEQVREFQTLVRELHRVGIEVILDVVYNHTAEGDRLGPTLAFRGIDNRSYYRLAEGDLRTYVNHTGCGNTLDLRHPRVLALVIDSLRYWVEIMHVDGFRFDLASALARDPETFDPRAAFFRALRSDPRLAAVKLVAEPWDATGDGYRLGAYPPPWREWNDRYRDGVRRWWRGDMGHAATLAARVGGSPDVFAPVGRGPSASVNFVTAHDGFSLHDLVSFERKHNDDNREGNRDGTDENWSWNSGIEGPSDDPDVRALRARQQRNLLATVLLSQGVPMLRAGDEIGQTQDGNNNAYCQDNPMTWLDWELDTERRALLTVTRRLTSIARRHPGLRGVAPAVDDREATIRGADVIWYAASGAPMQDRDWHDPGRRTLGLRIAIGTAWAPPAAATSRSAAPQDAAAPGAATLMVLLNAAPDTIEFMLPADVPGPWAPLFDSARDDLVAGPVAEGRYELRGRSLAILAPQPPIGR